MNPEQDTNTVHICGWNATGKGVLAKLLDGHPELAVISFDDSLASAFARMQDLQEASYRTDPNVFNLSVFYQAVADSYCRYHRIQSGHHGLPLRLAPSVEDIQLRTFRGFDFYEFEEDWVNEVNALESFDPYTIMMKIYHSFFLHWKKYEYDRNKCKYYVGFGGKDIEEVEFLLKNDSKVIFMRRDPRGIIASLGDKDIQDKDTMGFLKNGEIFEIQSYNKKMIRLSKMYPENIHVVDFEDVITEHKSTVESVRNFLDINQDRILNEPTLCGEALPDVEYVGSINDKWGDMMSRDEQRVANLQLGKASVSDIRAEAMYCYLFTALMIVLRSILSRTKKKIEQTRLYS